MSKTTSTPRILVVDDNPTNLQILFKALKKTGYQLFIDESGEHALGQIESIHPDLILLDIKMPGLNGFEVCSRLKNNPNTRSIPVIFLTALSAVEDKVQAFDLGGVDYITKPIQHEELLARIRTHLTVTNLRKDLEETNGELQKKNEALNKKTQELDSLNQNKNKFFSILAHDLRGPLGGLYHILEDFDVNFSQYSQEEIQEMANAMHGSIKSIYTMLDNLLLWSRVQMHHIEFRPECTTFGAIMEAVLGGFETMLEDKQIKLVKEIDPTLELDADVNMLVTVLRNLISNGIKYSYPNSKLILKTEQTGEKLVIIVQDFGVGISETDLQRLFHIDQKFTRVGTAKERGSGLGLILSKDFIELHHGSIAVTTKLKEGTTFTLTIPLNLSTILKTKKRHHSDLE
jgi:two-component system, sensor histidine kinase and response regulator